MEGTSLFVSTDASSIHSKILIFHFTTPSQIPLQFCIALLRELGNFVPSVSVRSALLSLWMLAMVEEHCSHQEQLTALMAGLDCFATVLSRNDDSGSLWARRLQVLDSALRHISGHQTVTGQAAHVLFSSGQLESVPQFSPFFFFFHFYVH